MKAFFSLSIYLLLFFSVRLVLAQNIEISGYVAEELGIEKFNNKTYRLEQDRDYVVWFKFKNLGNTTITFDTIQVDWQGKVKISSKTHKENDKYFLQKDSSIEFEYSTDGSGNDLVKNMANKSIKLFIVLKLGNLTVAGKYVAELPDFEILSKYPTYVKNQGVSLTKRIKEKGKEYYKLNFTLDNETNESGEKDLIACKSKYDFEQYIVKYPASENAFVAVQKIASPYIDKKDWTSAIQVFDKYLPSFPKMKNRFLKIIDLLKADDDDLHIKSISNINTDKYQEVSPVPTADGKILYFCGDSRPDGVGDEDIFYSEFLDNEWQKPILMAYNINTTKPESPKSISADGNKLVIFGNYEDSFGGGDMWYIEKTETGWSTKIHFPEPINSKYFDSDGFFTADGKAFIFTSDRPGGTGNPHDKGKGFHGGYGGNTDIWVCTKTKTGWSEPINLGTTINTPYAERAAFLHPDGKTLYFSSEGHYGLGSLDVYKSVRLSGKSWTEWSEPVNLGKNINTSNIDYGYRVSTEGDVAYYASSINNNQYDIYYITLPKAAKPEDFVVTISGKVVDEKGKPMKAEIKWENLETKEEVGVLESDPQNGKFFIVLPAGKNYGYFASKEGYISVNQNVNLKNLNENKKISINIKLISEESLITGTDTLVLNNIFFDHDSYELKSESYSELDRLMDFIKNRTKKIIQISGHTDSDGERYYNQKLSLNRAQAVVDYLVSKGIKKTNIRAKGFGPDKPVATNESEDGKAKNRRVEFNIVKK
ncbi:MAG: OmpA family protein [Bacteroidota bacterium]